jgi:sulfur-oxidizing protein SoxA
MRMRQALIRLVLVHAWSGIPLGAAAAKPVSGFAFLSPETQAMQIDDFANPGMSTVDAGGALFHQTWDSGRSCASCHGEKARPLDPQRIASYPVYSKQLRRPVTLQERIHLCWEEQLDNFPMAYDSDNAIALETYVRHLARGQPVQVVIEGPLHPFYERGRELYETRFGQIDMACALCHDDHQGQWLRGQRLTQGQTNAFPVYRLARGRISSLQQRLRECFLSFRAEPFEPGSEEFRALEVYLNARGNSLPIETPGVRP